MMGRHAADGVLVASHRIGSPREVFRDPASFWFYLERFTIRRYATDFFSPENYRPVVGFVCGVIFVLAGIVRMFDRPGWASLGFILVGGGLALLCFLVPLLLDLVVAYLAGFARRSRRPRGGRRRKY